MAEALKVLALLAGMVPFGFRACKSSEIPAPQCPQPEQAVPSYVTLQSQIHPQAVCQPVMCLAGLPQCLH